MSDLLQFARRFIQPGNVAALATLLVALGIETDQVFLHHCLEVLGAILAVIAFFLAGSTKPEPAKPEPEPEPLIIKP